MPHVMHAWTSTPSAAVPEVIGWVQYKELVLPPESQSGLDGVVGDAGWLAGLAVRESESLL